MSPKLKLSYFEVPARAETARILLAISGLPWENDVVTPPIWKAGELKAKSPFGQLPLLEIDDKFTLAQSSAINRYLARVANLYPEDPLEAAKTEMAAIQFDEAFELLYGTGKIRDAEEKVKAREELVAGSFGQKIKALETLVAASGGDYVLGSKLSWADVVIYSGLSIIHTGFFDGVPKDFDDSYPALKKLRNAVAKHPAVLARYAETTDNRVGFKPDA